MKNRKPPGKNVQKGKIESKKDKTFNKSLMIFSGALVLLIGGLVLFTNQVRTTVAEEITIYKSPSCKCCDKWVNHLRDEGFTVTTKNSNDMKDIKSYTGVKRELQSCHTALVDGYVIEGHVPASDIKRLLLERPDVSGLTAPGMPKGSPGMEGRHKDSYDVLTFDQKGQTKVFASH